MQLLISIKNVDEAMVALETGVDILDLKDPNIGALGALDLKTTERILQNIQAFQALTFQQSQPLISATVGEEHADMAVLIQMIDIRIKMGINMIKIAVSDLRRKNLLSKLNKQAQQVKLVAVFFADQAIDLDFLQQLKVHGFYAAMLDTQKKQQNLIQICADATLQNFVQKCHEIGLKTGLAGSLKPQHIAHLANINPSYIGFRGGVCADNLRKSILIPEKIIKVKKLLREHNKCNDLTYFS